MQFSTLLNLGLAAISGVAAAPTDPPKVEITFIGGPASYNVTYHGGTQLTENDLSVSLIRSANYNVNQCTFYFVSPAATINNGGIISVGPPSPVAAFNCPFTDQKCIPNYGDCFSSVTGQFIGSCCDGFCAANKCRPFTGV